MNASQMQEQLQSAAGHVVAGLRRVANRAFYLWPHEAEKVASYVGYSYTIPKEEQIRCEFYRHLDSRDESGPSFELEWNLYERTGRGPRAMPSRSGEIDLVGFHGGKIVAVFEVKRIWMLQGWNNKPAELLLGVETDVEKVKRMTSLLKLHEPDHVPLAGVIVASFADSLDRMEQLRGGLRKRFPRTMPLNEDTTAHVCRDQDDGENEPSRFVYMCSDLVPIDS